MYGGSSFDPVFCTTFDHIIVVWLIQMHAWIKVVINILCFAVMYLKNVYYMQGSCTACIMNWSWQMNSRFTSIDMLDCEYSFTYVVP